MPAELDFHTLDVDPQETREWLDAFESVVDHHGTERANYLLTRLLKHAQVERVSLPALVQTPYVNTIHVDHEPAYPGDEDIERRIRRYIRWNAVAMVLRQNLQHPGIGGHLATYASAATLYEVGFDHFFRGKADGPGDMIFYQGHASPGIYARAYIEGRLAEDDLHRFRREVDAPGLSSYPHPWLMPDFWEFPTVSMGLGPIAGIYQARFNRYLQARGLARTEDTRVWCFLGDGECDEPEALGALHLASRERLGNLIFVVNCNLQRLDGPVRGNGKVIQELEAVFHGAGWRVIKVIWGREWDELLAADHDGLLVRRMGAALDGDYQKYSVEDGGYVREHFFGTRPELRAMVDHLSDDEVWHLRRGGHDTRKVYAAYHAACEELERPTVILAKTVKGWTLGEGAEGRNVAHQTKKMKIAELKVFRDRLELDVPDEQLEHPPYIRFPEGSPELTYLHERRHALGGSIPERKVTSVSFPAPPLDFYARFLESSGAQEVSSTGAFARLLAQLMGHEEFGRRIVPIIPDEARTFGLDALFRKYGIYSSKGQLYEPVDKDVYLYYREATDGQVLEEGICEAGCTASFIAAGTSYAAFGEPMIPFYIFYSMFGFQRTGDQVWAAGDQRARGFLIGGTAGRTTLGGEGLQHCDGHSHVLATTYPHVRAYDPCYAYELAVIIQHGMERLLTEEHDEIYYITVMNEAYSMPAMPAGEEVQRGILAGMYRLRAASPRGDGRCVRLFGSGAILREVIEAADLLADRFDVTAEVWSVTSYQQLRREALAAERWNRLHPGEAPRRSFVETALGDTAWPIVAASDYMTLVPDQIARWVPGPMRVLGTDGFGRSDERASLRRHFEVDAASIACAALAALAERGTIDAGQAREALGALGVDPEQPDPATA
jgi:pyruvate dehydrogenase E1 component